MLQDKTEKCSLCGGSPRLIGGRCLVCLRDSPLALYGLPVTNPHMLMPACSELELVIKPAKTVDTDVSYMLFGFMSCGCGHVKAVKFGGKNDVHYMLSHYLAGLVSDLQKKLEYHASTCERLRKITEG